MRLDVIMVLVALVFLSRAVYSYCYMWDSVLESLCYIY